MLVGDAPRGGSTFVVLLKVLVHDERHPQFLRIGANWDGPPVLRTESTLRHSNNDHILDAIASPRDQRKRKKKPVDQHAQEHIQRRCRVLMIGLARDRVSDFHVSIGRLATITAIGSQLGHVADGDGRLCRVGPRNVMNVFPAGRTLALG